jgi:hypothetical protein
MKDGLLILIQCLSMTWSVMHPWLPLAFLFCWNLENAKCSRSSSISSSRVINEHTYKRRFIFLLHNLIISGQICVTFRLQVLDMVMPVDVAVWGSLPSMGGALHIDVDLIRRQYHLCHITYKPRTLSRIKSPTSLLLRWINQVGGLSHEWNSWSMSICWLWWLIMMSHKWNHMHHIQNYLNCLPVDLSPFNRCFSENTHTLNQK